MTTTTTTTTIMTITSMMIMTMTTLQVLVGREHGGASGVLATQLKARLDECEAANCTLNGLQLYQDMTGAKY